MHMGKRRKGTDLSTYMSTLRRHQYNSITYHTNILMPYMFLFRYTRVNDKTAYV